MKRSMGTSSGVQWPAHQAGTSPPTSAPRPAGPRPGLAGCRAASRHRGTASTLRARARHGDTAGASGRGHDQPSGVHSRSTRLVRMSSGVAWGTGGRGGPRDRTRPPGSGSPGFSRGTRNRGTGVREAPKKRPTLGGPVCCGAPPVHLRTRVRPLRGAGCPLLGRRHDAHRRRTQRHPRLTVPRHRHRAPFRELQLRWAATRLPSMPPPATSGTRWSAVNGSPGRGAGHTRRSGRPRRAGLGGRADTRSRSRDGMANHGVAPVLAHGAHSGCAGSVSGSRARGRVAGPSEPRYRGSGVVGRGRPNGGARDGRT